jgi:ankyrin repeat protein
MCSAIQLLISKGANPKQKDIFGSTPLDWLKNYSTLPQTIKDAAIKQLDEGLF